MNCINFPANIFSHNELQVPLRQQRLKCPQVQHNEHRPKQKAPEHWFMMDKAFAQVSIFSKTLSL
jgi:hypothetical protein